MNPVDEFLVYDKGMEKEAMSEGAKSAFLKALGYGAGTTAAIAGTAIVTGAAQDVLDMARNSVSRSIGFRDMIKENPGIGKLDRKQTKAYYNTLHRFSPEMARDPVVAASWVKRMGEFDYVDPGTIQQLVSTSERMRGAQSQRRIPPFQLAQAGVQAGLDTFKEQRTDLTPAQQAMLAGQEAAQLRGTQAKAQIEAAFKRQAATREMEMGRRMAAWRAEGEQGPIPSIPK